MSGILYNREPFTARQDSAGLQETGALCVSYHRDLYWMNIEKLSDGQFKRNSNMF